MNLFLLLPGSSKLSSGFCSYCNHFIFLGAKQFVGQIQDVHFYRKALTNRFVVILRYFNRSFTNQTQFQVKTIILYYVEMKSFVSLIFVFLVEIFFIKFFVSLWWPFCTLFIFLKTFLVSYFNFALPNLNDYIVDFSRHREVVEAYTGVFPMTYIASECRCPASHPKISTRIPGRKCVKNSDILEKNLVSRLSDTAHPIKFAADSDSSSYWLSTNVDNVTIDIDLLYNGLQVSSSFVDVRSLVKALFLSS